MREPLPSPTTGDWGLIYFFELELDEVTRLTTATTDQVIDGETYDAIGRLGKITSVKEGLNLLISQVTVSLIGIPIELFPIVSAEKYRNRPAKLMIGMWEDGLVGDPITLLSGKVLESSISPSHDMSVSLVISSDLSTMKYSVSSRYSNSEQQVLYPDDQGLSFVTSLKDLQLNWGMI